MLHKLLSTTKTLAQYANVQWLRLWVIPFVAATVFLPELVQAGTSAIFDDLGTEADSAVFGPLGQAVIAFAAVAGAIFAIIKGAFLLAGLGIAVAGLMYAANIVIGSAAFGALI
jgi:hypothetical protein